MLPDVDHWGTPSAMTTRRNRGDTEETPFSPPCDPPYLRCDPGASSDGASCGTNSTLSQWSGPANALGPAQAADRAWPSGYEPSKRGESQDGSRYGEAEAHGVSCDTNWQSRATVTETPVVAPTESIPLRERRIKDMAGMYSLTFDRRSVVVLMDDMESVMDGPDRMVGETEVFARMAGCWQRAMS